MPEETAGPSVLYIEDEPAMVRLVERILGKRGYDLTVVNNGPGGLAHMEETVPDLLLLDLMLPDMDGWEIYRRVREDNRLKDLPVIIVSAKGHAIDVARGLHVVGAQGYVTKPFMPDELMKAIDKALNTE